MIKVLDYAFYIRKWIAMANSGFMPNNDAADYGIIVTKATGSSGWHWRAIGIHHLRGFENQGNHHAYIDVLDEHGERVDAQVKFRWVGQRPDEKPSPIQIDKPLNEPGGNYAINQGQVLSFWVSDPDYPSDTVSGVSIQHNDEGMGNTWGHHSFLICWHLMKGHESVPIIVPPIKQPEIEPINFTGQIIQDGDDYLIRIPRKAFATQQRITNWAEVA